MIPTMADKPHNPVAPLETMPLNELAPAERIVAAKEAAICIFEAAYKLCLRATITGQECKDMLSSDSTDDIEMRHNKVREMELERDRFKEMVQQAALDIEPHSIHYDGFREDPVKLGNQSYTNAHLAALRTAQNVSAIIDDIDYTLLPFCFEMEISQGEDDPSLLPERRIYERLSQLGRDYGGQSDHLVAMIQIEAARALRQAPAKDPKWPSIPEEDMVLKALNTVGEPLRQSKLLEKAKLTDSGTNKQLLAWMVERGMLNNKGKGFYPAEWDKR